MQRLLSAFAVTGRAREAAEPGETNDPRMERAMAEMEREMAGMDENNPDPRQLGRLMRKMAEASGQKMPGEMEHMLERLESGEDPEKLEEEFGDALEGLGEGAFGEPDSEDPGGERRGPKPLRPRPTRDPQLYEMREYL
jgi:hypothetical protein